MIKYSNFFSIIEYTNYNKLLFLPLLNYLTHNIVNYYYRKLMDKLYSKIHKLMQ